MAFNLLRFGFSALMGVLIGTVNLTSPHAFLIMIMLGFAHGIGSAFFAHRTSNPKRASWQQIGVCCLAVTVAFLLAG